MRLLNASSHDFAEFYDSNIPRYAILSHCWQYETLGNSNSCETTYKDFLRGRNASKSGHQKVVKFCSLASELGYDWVWVDTCCIDKRSSAEVAEAINSMYQWYKKAGICIVYLQDVRIFPDLVGMPRDIQDSQYFDRGWTLQELLAPRDVEFYDCRWNRITSKRESAAIIEERTDIPVRVLMEPSMIPRISVARRMSWASHRTTTRVEDMAYCLLGIFEVGISLRYGEGEEAFQRLQHAIIESVADESIFAWTIRSYSGRISERPFQGLLATSPYAFATCGDVVQIRAWRRHCHPVQMTSQGARMCSNLTPTTLQSPVGDQTVYHQELLCAHTRSRSSFLDMTIDVKVVKEKQLNACFLLVGRKSADEMTYWRVPRGFGFALSKISVELLESSQECKTIYVGTKWTPESVIDVVFHTSLEQFSLPAGPSQALQRSRSQDIGPTSSSLGAMYMYHEPLRKTTPPPTGTALRRRFDLGNLESGGWPNSRPFSQDFKPHQTFDHTKAMTSYFGHPSDTVGNIYDPTSTRRGSTKVWNFKAESPHVHSSPGQDYEDDLSTF